MWSLAEDDWKAGAERLSWKAERGRKSKHDADRERNGKSKQKHSPIDGDILDARNRGGDMNDRPQRKRGEEQARCAARYAQQYAFGEKLAHQPHATGSQGRPYCDLPLPRRGPG